MAVRHLSEDQIQEYLDNTIVSGKQDIITHLDSCPICRSRVKEYETLFLQIKETEPEFLPADFASKVMTAIETESSGIGQRSTWSVIFVILGTLVGLITIGYFVNLRPLADLFNVSDVRQYCSVILFDGIKDITGLFNVDIGTILYVGLTLIVIAAIDIIIRHNRRRPVSFLI
jgi:hypothetical protein